MKEFIVFALVFGGLCALALLGANYLCADTEDEPTCVAALNQPEEMHADP